jgi:hypothetical protein
MENVTIYFSGCKSLPMHPHPCRLGNSQFLEEEKRLNSTEKPVLLLFNKRRTMLLKETDNSALHV